MADIVFEIIFFIGLCIILIFSLNWEEINQRIRGFFKR